MELKTALITGANRGIGFETCRQLLHLGWQVYATARKPDTATKLTELQQQFPDRLHIQQLDVAERPSVQSLAEQLYQSPGKLDVLINNAGVFIDKTNLTDLNDGILAATMNTNFYGPLWLTQACLPLLYKSSGARIINISSGLGAMNDMGGGFPAYRLSKASLNAFTGILAAELNGRVKVNSVCPGWVATDMGGHGAPRSIEKGAETPVWLATAADIPTGKFLRDKQIIDW